MFRSRSCPAATAAPRSTERTRTHTCATQPASSNSSCSPSGSTRVASRRSSPPTSTRRPVSSRSGGPAGPYAGTRPDPRPLGWRDAHRDVERQLRPLPDRPCRGLRAAPGDRRTRASRSPRPATTSGRRWGSRHWGTTSRPSATTSGTASRSSAGSASRTSSTASTACRSSATRWPPRPVRSGRRATGSGCGRYIPDGRKPNDPLPLPGSRPCAAPRPAGPPSSRISRRPSSVTGTSRRRTTTSSTSRSCAKSTRVAAPEQGGVPGRRRRRVRGAWCAPHLPGPEVYACSDCYQQRFEAAQPRMARRLMLGSPAFATRVAGAVVDRDERAGTRPATTPVIIKLSDVDLVGAAGRGRSHGRVEPQPVPGRSRTPCAARPAGPRRRAGGTQRSW